MEQRPLESAPLEVKSMQEEEILTKNTEINTHLVKRSKFKKTIWYITGILEVLLAFRLVFKVLGANPGSTFVSVIYNVSGAFLAPFNGIFRSAVNNGIETESVLEPMTLIAMVVYAIIAYGIVRLIEIYDPKKNV